MARTANIRGLVDRFAQELERAVTIRVNADFAGRFDELRRSILKGATRAPSLSGGIKGRSGPRPGYVVPEKPCPVCGTPTKARRFSYLCDEHRSTENLSKFKGAGGGEAPKAAPAAKAKPGKKAKAKKTA